MSEDKEVMAELLTRKNDDRMPSEDREMSGGGVGFSRTVPVDRDGGGDHLDLYLQEIEAVDDYWGPTFRAIYEANRPKTEAEERLEADSSSSSTGINAQTFIKRLSERIDEHDGEIEKMCNHHYRGFISSVRDLLGVRAEAARLKAEVISVDEDIRKSAAKVALRADELVKARRVERNIAATIESLSLCLPVLQMFTKLNKQMSDKRYHPALKTLEQLEHTYIPRIVKYRFSKQMKSSIPKLRESIKEASMTELRDFLENIRKYSPKIGEVAMRNTAIRLNIDPSAYGANNSKRDANDLINPAKRLQISGQPPNPFTGEVDYEGQSESTVDTEEELAVQDLVDFSPVYRCLHIYTVLGERDAFEKYYRKQRRQQATLTLQPPSNMHESVDGYRIFFHGIVGFFVCEDHVLNTGNGLVTRSYLDELWTTTSARIMSTLQTHSASATDSNFMMKIKHLMLLFSSTLQNYGFSSDKMYGLLQELRDHYTEVLMQKWVQKFRDIFEIDNYHPIEVSRHIVGSNFFHTADTFPFQVLTPVEYDNIIETFPYNPPPSLSESPYPRQFPFSAMVPRVYNEVKDFILSCVQFSQDLNLSPEEVDDTVRKATNILISRTLSGCLSSLIRRENLSLLQLIQIDINTYHLEDTNVHLERYISDITGASLEATHIARLQGRSIFKDIRVEAEEEILSKLISKIDEFIELAHYDWTMSEPQGMSSSWLSDLIAFMNSVFLSFTNLPLTLAQNTCMRGLKHLANSILEMLTDETVKALSMGLIQQMDLDVVQCEQFAASEPVAGLEVRKQSSKF